MISNEFKIFIFHLSAFLLMTVSSCRVTVVRSDPQVLLGLLDLL